MRVIISIEALSFFSAGKRNSVMAIVEEAGLLFLEEELYNQLSSETNTGFYTGNNF